MPTYRLIYKGNKGDKRYTVDCIKALRRTFDLSLKEAADIVRGAQLNGHAEFINTHYTEIEYARFAEFPLEYFLRMTDKNPKIEPQTLIEKFPPVDLDEVMELHIRACYNLQLDVAQHTLAVIRLLKVDSVTRS